MNKFSLYINTLKEIPKQADQADVITTRLRRCELWALRIKRNIDIKSERQADRQTDRQRKTETERQKERETDRQIDTDTLKREKYIFHNPLPLLSDVTVREACTSDLDFKRRNFESSEFPADRDLKFLHPWYPTAGSIQETGIPNPGGGSTTPVRTVRQSYPPTSSEASTCIRNRCQTQFSSDNHKRRPEATTRTSSVRCFLLFLWLKVQMTHNVRGSWHKIIT